MITRRRLLQLAGAGLVAGLAAAAYPFIEVMAAPVVTRYAFTPRNWTPGLRLRVAVIADIHACEPWMSIERIESVGRQAETLEPDLILLLGDYTSSMRLVFSHVAPSAWAAALARLSAPLGVHAVMGNHDYWDDEVFQHDQSVMPFAFAALREAGIPTYRNESVRLEKDGMPFWLAGLDDQMALLPGRRYSRSEMLGVDDLDSTLAQVTGEGPVLLLAHEPDVFPRVPDRVSLTLSGHTHGGQFNLFGFRPFSASIGSRRFPAGYFKVEGRELIVSRGLGCSAVPMRVGSWPEIVLLELGEA